MRQFQEYKVFPNQTVEMENRDESRRVPGLLTGSDYLVGSLCVDGGLLHSASITAVF